MRILLVEDHLNLSDLLAGHLKARGFSIDTVATGQQALDAAEATHFNAMILDLGLPDIDGLDVLKTLRARPACDFPVLILTARDQVAQRIAGLDAGADDYILKPVDIAELEARLRAVLRRPGTRLSPVHQFASLMFDTATRTATHHGTALDLTPREAALLEELIRAGQSIVLRDTLTERLYSAGEDVSPNALEATVSRLRRKLASAGASVRIDTLRGIGYRLAA